MERSQKNNCVIHFTGQRVLINGQVPDCDPIVQAKAQTSWLKECLRSRTARSFDAIHQPVRTLRFAGRLR